MVLVAAPAVRATDTLEVWDAGSGNFEMYSGYGGVGARTEEQSIGSSMVLGWGVARGFSAYVGTALAADGNFDQTETELDLGARRQLVLEYDITLHDRPEPGTPDLERGALALGYNVLLSDSLELITEARLDVPQFDESATLGLVVGVIPALD